MQSAKCQVQSRDERQRDGSPFFTLHSALRTLHFELNFLDRLLAATIRLALALFLAAILSGCGGSTAPETTKAGTESVTFHVKDMGKRLALM